MKTVGILLATVLTFGCGGNTQAPSAGSTQGVVPDLRGRRVMVFPVQIGSRVPGDASPEIAFVLRNRTSEVAWVFSDEMEAIKERSPAIDVAVRGLPVGVFLNAGMLLPAAPGYIGIYQIACIFALGLYGVGEAEAVAFSVVMQLVVLSVLLVSGGAAMVSCGFRLTPGAARNVVAMARETTDEGPDKRGAPVP